MDKDYLKFTIAILVGWLLLIARYWYYFYSGGAWLDDNIILDIFTLEILILIFTIIVRLIFKNGKALSLMCTSFPVLSIVLMLTATNKVAKYKERQWNT